MQNLAIKVYKVIRIRLTVTLALAACINAFLVPPTFADVDLHERELLLEQRSAVLAQRGEGVVTRADLDIWLSRVSEESRAGFLASSDRLGQVIDRLMISRQLAARAIERGGAADDDFVAYMFQTAMVLLAEQETDRVWQEARLNSYRQRAEEYYLLNRDTFRAENTVDFTYLSIEHGEASRSRREISDIHEVILAGEVGFDEAVRQYSQAPDVDENQGRFQNVPPDELEPAFAEVLSTLDTGELSSPFLTPFGYVLVRLDAREIEGRQLEFEEVAEQLEAQMELRHRQDVVDRLRGRLLSESEIVIDMDAVATLFNDYQVLSAEERRQLLEDTRARLSDD